MASIPAPKNRLKNIIDIFIDGLFLGLGENLIIGAIVAAEPFLANPFCMFIVRTVVGWFVRPIDEGLKRNIDAVVIRFQGEISQKVFDGAITKLKQDQSIPGGDPNGTDEQAARDAADSFIHGGRNI